MKRYVLFFLWIYLIAYTVLLLLHLDKIPLVWFDEVMGLDPAVNLVFKDGYRSMIWPQTGTEDHFMAYLPVRFIFHSAHLSSLPFTVFWQRLPWVLYFLTSVVLILWAARTQTSDWSVILLLAFLFINDKTVFEVARSMRVDPLSLMFLAFTAVVYFKQKYIVQSVLASILVFIHPNLWWIALVLFFDAAIKYNNLKKRRYFVPNLLWISPLFFLAVYLWSIDLNVDALYTQLFEHGSKHSAEGGIANRLKAHLFDRFWPYYKTQPYMPLFILFGLISAVYRTVKKKAQVWDLALIGTHIFWLLILAPFYRYNAVLLLLTIISLLPYLPKLKENIYAFGFVVLFILIHPANVMARHAMAITQSQERDPKPVLSWLQDELTEEKTLIFGHDIAYYAVAKDRQKDYMMFNLLPTKFDYADYNKVMVLSSDSIMLDEVHFVSKYHSLASRSQSLFKEAFMSKPTYRELYLFEVRSKSAFERCLEFLDERNVSVNRP